MVSLILYVTISVVASDFETFSQLSVTDGVQSTFDDTEKVVDPEVDDTVFDAGSTLR